MFKIATTETYDPTLCIDEWIKRDREFDFLLYITKVLNSRIINILTDEKSLWAWMNKPSVLHLTVTGWGGTDIEPNVDFPVNVFQKAMKLIEAGFPKERIVARIDPLIPTWLGTSKLYYMTDMALAAGISRIRSSVLQLYPHSADRLKESEEWPEIEKIYKGNFWPDIDINLKVKTFRESVPSIIEECRKTAKKEWGIENVYFESCATKLLADCGFENIGCMSERDLIINGLNPDELNIPKGNQRSNCMCLMKHQLIPGGYKRGRCPHKCAYCYLKDSPEQKDAVKSNELF